jgi:hypothetical protein
MTYILIVVIVTGSFYAAWSERIQTTTKWLSMRIEEAKVVRTPHGLASVLEIQTAITPRWQIGRIWVMIVWCGTVIGLGIWIKWWIGGLALLALFVGGGIVGAVFLPRRRTYWIRRVSSGLEQRIMRYQNKGDLESIEALSQFLPVLEELARRADSDGIQSMDM